jgi:hypothetical protein
VNASGITLALLGVVVIAQVVSGGALQRLGIIGCPAGQNTDTSKPPSGGGLPNQPGGGSPPQMPPRFSG